MHRIVTDVGLTKLRCQRSRVGSAAAATQGLQGLRTSTRSTASGQAASWFWGSGISSQGHRICRTQRGPRPWGTRRPL
ncbi:hypothetical protein NDU88_005736 [Pleurodeles waltl]|uniref:Uncharacterized protein n=1 Tax=Pleurodeles waltl TaxID=8319 RepID=A0AAV7SMJ8_PLEWA|nr:hypothetical protein NDU88_005736 [Pleurodeles waltl]